jgi:hypothetical protein
MLSGPKGTEEELISQCSILWAYGGVIWPSWNN